MKIYLAHNYSARDYLRNQIKPILESLGHEITSSWLIDDHSDRSEIKKKQFAEIDCYDIFRADTLILFADQYGDRPGLGKFIEFGVAHCNNKKIFVIGFIDSVFFYLHGVTRFNTFSEFCEYFKEDKQNK